MNCLCFRGGEQEITPKQTIDQASGAEKVMFYAYKELRVATKNFSKANKIGEGGFGSVYKGRLANGTAVAVKLLSPESNQGVQEFLTELIIIASVHHENLIKLHGCCVEANNRILVYEYLQNRSLSETLLGVRHYTLKFSWQVRKNICIGVAKGLAYLHDELSPYIIHRDIKASNILLDEDLNAKISDFGLAKLLPSSMTHVSTRVAGTLGYLAPEYAIQGHLNRKSDIYSFGVLLLEIICGRCNRSKRLPLGQEYLIEMAWIAHERNNPKDLVELVDESLRGDLDVEEACRFFKVALLCTQGTQKLRPSMSNVVKMLQGEVDLSKMVVRNPGLLSDLMGIKPKENQKAEHDNSPNSPSLLSPSSGKLDSPSSTITTYPAMTFTLP